jgi:hypothetical protein
MMNILKRFDKFSALKAFVGKRSERMLGDFLDKVGVENICKCIESGVMVTDKIPDRDKMIWRAQLEQFKGLFYIFEDHDLYNWIPQRYREYFEKKYGTVYTEYMKKQCKAIRDFLIY